MPCAKGWGMSENSVKNFQEEVQRKIRNLLAEFGEGKLSNEQFNILYERYNNQLEMALQARDEQNAIASGTVDSNIAIKQATTGKALGMAIYHHRSGTIIETLGTFDLSPDVISPTINDFSRKLEQREFIAPITRKLSSGLWVIFMARHFTTAVVIFKNEPAPHQIRELERLLHDFEEANRVYLDKLQVDRDKLAKPFLGFVRRKLTR
jgi:hypothetical protein